MIEINYQIINFKLYFYFLKISKFRPKIKELLIVILKICDIDEEGINNIFINRDKKKKSFFGF
jgi:hypothetical protein